MQKSNKKEKLDYYKILGLGKSENCRIVENMYRDGTRF